MEIAGSSQSLSGPFDRYPFLFCSEFKRSIHHVKDAAVFCKFPQRVRVRGATAPNAGAHRLAFWLARGLVERRALLIVHGVGADAIARMMAGTLVPVDDVAVAIARATEGDVLPEDWDAPGAAWATAPATRGDDA